MRCKFMMLAILFSWGLASSALAGNIDSPGTQPSAGSGMYTLQELYDYLVSGIAPSLSGVFGEPAAGPGSTGKTTKGIYDGIKALFDAANATAGQVLDNATFFSTDPANWGPTTGTIATQTPSGATASQPAGYYEAFDLSAVDTDLAAGNIRSGAEIFGVSGSSTVVNTATASGAAAGDILSGRTAFVNGSAVTGSVPAGSSVTGTDGSLTMTIPDGLYSGSKTATANDANLVTGNIKSDVSIFGVSGSTTVVDTATATPAAAVDIRSGETAFVNGEAVNGSMPTNTLSSASTTVGAGYYDSTTLDAVDADLSTANIKSGINIFGVDGNYPTAAVEKTGQTECWDESGTPITCTGTGHDGEYQKGSTWPSPRFTDNGDGTVTDNTTGLIWLKDADCLETIGGIDRSFGELTWVNALTWCNNLSNGSCGLTDGSTAGDWRLPNVKELFSLIDFGNVRLALPSGHPFLNVWDEAYWSGTSLADPGVGQAWWVDMYYGKIDLGSKTGVYRVWPVLGGQ